MRRPLLMAVRCAWCGDAMPGTPCAPEQSGAVSHGMCPTCERRVSLAIPDALTPVFRATLRGAAVKPRRIRGEDTKVIAAAIRALFRTIGLTGASVTCGRGTASIYVDVTLPTVRCDRRSEHAPDEWRRCPTCQRRKAAERRVNYFILTAFPDLGDRSDYQSDSYDFVYSVHV